MKTGLSQHPRPPAGTADQSAPVPGDGHALHADDGPAAAPQAGAARQSRSSNCSSRRRRSRMARDREKPTRSRRRRRPRRKTRWTGRRSCSTGSTSAARGSSTRSTSTSRRSRSQSRDLTDHLREQLKMLDLTPRQILLSEEFIGNIKDDGYLAAVARGDRRLRQPADHRARPGQRRPRRGTRPRRPRRRSRPRRAPRGRGALRAGGRGGDAPHRPGARPAGHRRPRPPGVPAAPAAASSARPRPSPIGWSSRRSATSSPIAGTTWPAGSACRPRRCRRPPTRWPRSTRSRGSSIPARTTATSRPT